jgi:WD40 repeat protein
VKTLFKHFSLFLIFLMLTGELITHAQQSGDRATISADNAALVIELGRLDGHEGSVNSVAFNPDGTRLVSGGDDSTVRIWGIESGDEEVQLEGHTGPVFAVAFNQDGTQVAAAGDFQHTALLVWDLMAAEIIGTSSPDHLSQAQIDFMVNNVGPINLFAVSFLPDGTPFANGTVMAYGAYSIAFVWEPDGAHGQASDLATSLPNVTSIATHLGRNLTVISKSDGSLTISDALSAEDSVTWQAHDDNVSSVTFSHDGLTIASASSDDTIKLWDLTDASEPVVIATIEGHTDDITAVSYNADSTLLVSGSLDSTVRIWDVATQQELVSLTGVDIVEIRSVAFSPDGTLIASAGNDGIISLWGVPDETNGTTGAAQIEGSITRDGNPEANVEVRLYSNLAVELELATTDSDGHYSFEVEADAYNISLRFPVTECVSASYEITGNFFDSNGSVISFTSSNASGETFLNLVGLTGTISQDETKDLNLDVRCG